MTPTTPISEESIGGRRHSNTVVVDDDIALRARSAVSIGQAH